MKALAVLAIAGAMLATPALAEETTLALTDDAATSLADDAAAADDIPPSVPEDPDRLRVTLMPYAWLAGVSGPINANGRGGGGSPLPPVDIDSGSSSAFDDLNFFGFAVGEISKGNWGATVDIAYVDFTFDASVDAPPPFDIDPTLDLKGSVSTIQGFYRFDDVAQDVDIDALVGMKVFWIDVALDLNGPLGILQADRSDSWVDVSFGARVRWTPGRWTLSAQGDVGFGDNTSNWGVVLLADYRFTEHFGIVGGYRWLDFENTKNSRDVDLTLSGPLIGATIRF